MQFKDSEKHQQFNGKALLGIDYGKRFVGLATYKVGIDPYPLPFLTLPYKDDPTLIKELLTHISDECIDEIVLGLPLYTDGTESEMTQTVRAFSEELKKKCSLPLHLQDETLTSFEAKERMKNSPAYNFTIDMSKVDELAASIILEDFLR